MYCTVVLDTRKGAFLLESDIDYTEIRDFLIGWIKTDIGRGEDERELKPKEEFYISIYKDRFSGEYDIEDNCENRDLRRGILGLFIAQFKHVRNQFMDNDKEYIRNIIYGEE